MLYEMRYRAVLASDIVDELTGEVKGVKTVLRKVYVESCDMNKVMEVARNILDRECATLECIKVVKEQIISC